MILRLAASAALLTAAVLCQGQAAQAGTPKSPVAAKTPAPSNPADYWWRHFPTFIGTNSPSEAVESKAREVLYGYGIDPTWGPYAQRLTMLTDAKGFREMKADGLRVTAWIEGFGDCMLYAASFERLADGSFLRRKDDPRMAQTRRTHWNWADRALPQGNVFRWIGLHNTTCDEDFVMPTFGREAVGLPAPTYPDGRPATGWLPGVRYPLNAEVYDACGSKDINGDLHPAFEAPKGVNEIDPATGKRRGPTKGLYPAILGKDDVAPVPGLKPGDTVYAGVISVHKDLSAPFWRQYVRLSIGTLARAGVDGVWCDNYSPWDNFGYPPVQKAFGDWSLAGFPKYLRARWSMAQIRAMGLSLAYKDVRAYLKAKAVEFGAKDPSNLRDRAWSDPRWLDDPVWGLYRAYRQQAAQRDLRAFYDAVHEAATKAGRPDFLLSGNDIPFYGLGWVHNGWLDQVSTELTPGWQMGSGTRGIMLPPEGKMAVVYRVGIEHQKAPFATAWYYVDKPYQHKPELGKLLCAEAFANGFFLKCAPGTPRVVGTLASHAWWNGFVRAHEADFGARRPWADVGVLFSPDNQLELLAPGGFPNMDRQPHIFGHWGWATALVDGHVPYRALTDWKLDAAGLAGLRVFVVPNAVSMTEAQAAALRAWVRGGGRLILCGECGTRYGPSGYFRRRGQSVVEGLVGHPLAVGQPRSERREGKGTVIWVPGTPGMDYYLQADSRPALLPAMLKLIGKPDLTDGSSLPRTVGLFAWRAPKGSALFADLVNYDIDKAADLMREAKNLHLRVKLPAGWHGAAVQTFSPDGTPPARLSVEGGWAALTLPRLVHYASIKLTRHSAR